MTTHSPDQSISQSPAPSKEMEERLRSILMSHFGRPLTESDRCAWDSAMDALRALAADYEQKIERLSPATQLLLDLITEGGAVVSSDACSELEIKSAQHFGRFAADNEGFGFVRHTKQWVRLNQLCNTQSPAPSKELERILATIEEIRRHERLSSGADEDLKNSIQSISDLAAELGKEREADRQFKRDFIKCFDWDTIEREHAELAKKEALVDLTGPNASKIEILQALVDLKADIDAAFPVESARDLLIETQRVSIDQLKRELAEANGTNEHLERRLQVAENTIRGTSDDYQVTRKERDDRRSQLLVLSASYQRQKEALEKLCEDKCVDDVTQSYIPRFGPDVQQIAYQALAETPDVSLLETCAIDAKFMLDQFIGWDSGGYIHVAGNLRDDWYGAAKRLLSTLQPDHQK